MVSKVEQMRLEKEAKERYSLEIPKNLILQRRYELWHDLIAPQAGDQWPNDRFERPGKIHITANFVRSFVDIEARLEAILPRITNKPDVEDDEVRKLAEMAEKLYSRYLEMSGWEVWLFTLNQVKATYGKSFLKPFWNIETDAPDVYVIEQPHHLMIGWGDNDFKQIDWAIYRTGLSPLRARMMYPNAPASAYRPVNLLEIARLPGGNDHFDPLGQLDDLDNAHPLRGTGYEANQVEHWDYWYISEDGMVRNCEFLNGNLVTGPYDHPEMPGIPYIPVEFDHEPGDPEGRGLPEALYDLQIGYNRALSHFAQYVWEETDPAYQLTGENAPMTVPDGLVPNANEIVAPGPGARIEPIAKGVNQFPLVDLVRTYRETAHMIAGLPEILFGGMPGQQTAARAIAMQIQSAINRIEPRRNRMYDALRQLFFFWGTMMTKKNHKLGPVPVGKLLKGLDRWHIIAPEITPRDVVEHTMNVINQLNAKVLSLESAMDQVGVENPLEEIDRVMRERSNARLFPGDAQAIAAVMLTLQQIQQTQAMQQSAGQGLAAGNEAAAAQGAALQDAQQAVPQGFEDQNMPGGPGLPPPPGAPAPIGGSLQPLVRQTPEGESQAMSQIVLPRQPV